MAQHDDFVSAAAAIVGAKHVLTDPTETAPYRTDWRGRYSRDALAVVFPGNTQEVSAIVQLCGSLGLPIVPQAGNTGLTGGAVPSASGNSVLLNVSRMDRVRELDLANNSLAVDAGCILANIRTVADENDRLFPMLLSSVGSCEVGGLISTNAGGTGVLRYGPMRDLVLGLEVVLSDGRVWDGMRALRKDNTGYDLKQLFIGAEGTLGIITGAVLKLHPKPKMSATGMVSLASVEDAVALLQLAQERSGSRVEAFEIMSRSQLALVLKHHPQMRSPISVDHPWFVMLELADSAAEAQPGTMLESILEQALDVGLISDGTLAADLAKAQRIWELRHNISEANKREGFTISNDTSVPISQQARFIEQVTARLEERFDGITICHCGHVGDGNIHVVAVLPRSIYATPQACESAAREINGIVHEASLALSGSISAEHGIGLMHVARLAQTKPPVDLDLMARVKAALDPRGTFNPGKILA
jgi:FAD/FMN-containing dehydrogenase